MPVTWSSAHVCVPWEPRVESTQLAPLSGPLLTQEIPDGGWGPCRHPCRSAWTFRDVSSPIFLVALGALRARSPAKSTLCAPYWSRGHGLPWGSRALQQPTGSPGHSLVHVHRLLLSPELNRTATVESGHRWLGDCNQHLLISSLLVTMESHYPSWNDLLFPIIMMQYRYEPHGGQGDRTLPHVAFLGACLWPHVPFL